MRQLLDYQADQIELVLRTHRVAGQVVGGIVTPRWIRYQLRLDLSARVVTVVKLSEEVALRLGVGTVRISRHGPTIHVEVPRQDPQSVYLMQLCDQLPEVPKQSTVLGMDEEGLPLLLRLPSPEVAHVLIAGTTGSGKTALAQSMALSLAMHNRLGEVQLLLIDPKGEGFGPLDGLPHLLRPVVREVHHAIFLLGELVEEMVRRDRSGISEPRVVVVIDEVADLIDQGGNAISRLLTRLTQRGRGAGIHIIACTQKPLAASIGSITRSNFPVRLVGSVASADDAKVAAGVGGTGAEKLLGRGDFLLITKGQVIRFQAAYVNRQQIYRLIGQLQDSQRQGRRWLAEESPIALAATGTDSLPGEKPRSRLKMLFGTQLRLLR
jgi:S-DNA-T family DNA segregation ATPase FtsK/SpoIIIE